MKYVLTDRATGVVMMAGSQDFKTVSECAEFVKQSHLRGYLVHWGWDTKTMELIAAEEGSNHVA